MIILLIGGSGSGKSAYAEKLVTLLPAKKRIYLATMQVQDKESVHRVSRHQVQRAAKSFQTIECPRGIGNIPVSLDCTVLLEDLPNLLANEMFDGGDWTRIIPDLQSLGQKCRHLVLVTGDIFSDGVIYPPSTQEYLQRLAEINAEAAKFADYTAEIVCSLPSDLKGTLPWPESKPSSSRKEHRMKLYVGGAYQGQEELARQENPGAEILTDFHESVRKALARGEDPRAFAREICAAHPDAILVSNEVGAGVVPTDPGERAFREAVGRALCVIAQEAETVTRIVCGIGVRIK